MKGCDKIENYWVNIEHNKVSKDILFTKNEIKEVYKDLFGDKARERDF